MSDAMISLLFRVCAGLLFLSLGIFLIQTFRKKEKRNILLYRAASIVLALMVIGIFTIIYYTANTDAHIQAVKNADSIDAGMVDRARQNMVFRDVQLFTGIMVHLIIISVIGVAYVLLWRRSAKMPHSPYTVAHRIILMLGFFVVLGFAAYAVYGCITDAEFREQVHIRTYSEFFVGNIFLMLVASIISAAGLPEGTDNI